MRKTLLALPLFISALSLPLVSHAWNAIGHMVVARVAYKNLKPAAKEKIDTLVSDMNQQYTDMDSFLDLATWPDAIRGQHIETYTHWHYVDVAFSNDGTPLKNLIDSDNALWAVNKIEPIVKNDHANPYERARFLAFFAHIVGDLHQPLHTVSYISAKTPDGDRGGNDYTVQVKNSKTNLHKLWDGGVGAFEGSNSPSHVDQLADTLMAEYPESSFGGKANDLKPEDWVKEGMENATQSVYSTPMNQTVSTAYLENGKRVAEQQAVLAGYRLAKLLNQLLA